MNDILTIWVQHCSVLFLKKPTGMLHMTREDIVGTEYITRKNFLYPFYLAYGTEAAVGKKR